MKILQQKNFIFKHISKTKQTSMNTDGKQGIMRGILGEVGNMTFSSKPAISQSKVTQQHFDEKTVETQSINSILSLSASSSSPSSKITTNVANQLEEIILDDDFVISTEIPTEFDCDSSDLYNLMDVSEFVVDICKYWKKLERHTPIRQNFLVHRREGRSS